MFKKVAYVKCPQSKSGKNLKMYMTDESGICPICGEYHDIVAYDTVETDEPCVCNGDTCPVNL